MGILLDGETKVIVQGITGKEASFWIEPMLEAGSNIVAGTSPYPTQDTVKNIPIYPTVKEAITEDPAEASVLFVPPLFAKDAALEALDNGLKLLVILADGVPIHDALEIKQAAYESNATVIGPNTPGIATIDQAMLGFIPTWLKDVYQPGQVGMMARSGSLINKIAYHVTQAGQGLSTVIGHGGDPVPGTRFKDLLPLFQADDQTKVLVLIGEIGGSMEEEVAEEVTTGRFRKPIISFIAGKTAPKGKKMGHAGALISRGEGSFESKKRALSNAGVKMASNPTEIEKLLTDIFKEMKE